MGHVYIGDKQKEQAGMLVASVTSEWDMVTCYLYDKQMEHVYIVHELRALPLQKKWDMH